MRYTNIFPNPVDRGFIRFTIDSNPKEHKGYSEHLGFDPKTHQQLVLGKWNLKYGEIIIRFFHIRGKRTLTMVSYREADKFSCKIDDVDSEEGDYHIEINGKRVPGKEHIPLNRELHPALFCLFQLLDELEPRDKTISVYFFFEEEVKRDPDILRLILENKPNSASTAQYCYVLAWLASEKGYDVKLDKVKEWKETHLLPAIEKLKETMQKQGYIQIPWTDEQRIFPIPVSATEGHKVIIESSYGTEKPKMPEFIQLLLKGASPSVKT